MPRPAPPSNFYRQSRVLDEEVQSKPVTLQLPAAHPKQYEFITVFDRMPNVRFAVCTAGTKFGKTYGSTIALVRHAWDNYNTLSWWVSPTFSQSKMAYSLIKRLLPMGTFVEYKADLKLVLLQPDGTERSVIEFKSGDNPDSLRGFGVNMFVMDEAARCPYESFVSILTTVTQTRGKGFFISTPKGRGWFYEIFQRGEKTYSDGSPKFSAEDPDPNPEWYSMKLPTWLSPKVSLESIREMKRNLPFDTFRQEIAAEFLTDSAGVFRGITACVKGFLEDPLKGRRYAIGVDLARLKDYSVICVMDVQKRHVVYMDRFNRIEWSVQYQRILDVCRQYRGPVVIDSTGIGDPIVEAIQGGGIHVDPYKISGSVAKQQLIDTLRVAIEKGTISFPNIPVLLKELESYEYEISDAGKIKYSAPANGHDDTVIALALAVHGLDAHLWRYRYLNERGI